MDNAFRKILKMSILLALSLVMLISTPALAINNSINNIDTTTSATTQNSNISNEEAIDKLYNWLIDIQLSNGALPVYGKVDGEASINPYFASIATLAIMKHPDESLGFKTAEDYFDWHFAHLNDDGSIYDYNAVVENKEIISENSKADYDSADSYAALFLISLWQYIQAGGSREYIIENEDDIYLVIDLMTSLIDEDGLAWVSNDNHTKYLMDNSEVYYGLYCSYKLLNEVFLSRYSLFEREYWEICKRIYVLKLSRMRMEVAIESKLWNEDKQMYEVGLNRDGSYIKVEGDRIYPLYSAQMFTVVFGVIKPESQRAQDLYDTFCDKFDWESLSHFKNDQTNFYWGVIAYYAAIMGDNERVKIYISSFAESALPELKYPAYNGDVGWTILAWEYTN